jgi:hypothetical protein
MKELIKKLKVKLIAIIRFMKRKMFSPRVEKEKGLKKKES